MNDVIKGDPSDFDRAIAAALHKERDPAVKRYAKKMLADRPAKPRQPRPRRKVRAAKAARRE